MFTKQRKRYRRIAVITTTTVVLSVSILGQPAYARPGGPGPGPGFHSIVPLGAMAFFFMDGLFYRRGPKGYIVAPAPMGVIIPALPPTAILVTIDGEPYYNCSGVFYKPTPEGYLVVSQPVKQVHPEISIGKDLLITAELLNVRSAPGLNFDVVGQLKKDNVVRVEAVSANWTLVRLPDDTTGWIKSEYTAVIQTGAKG